MSTPAVRLAFLADVQVGCMATFSGADDADIERFARRQMVVRHFPHTESFAWEEARFLSAVEMLNTLEPDIAVIGGDMIDDPAGPGQLEAFRRIAALSDTPLHCAPGNHDICWDAAVPTEDSIEWYREQFGPEHSTVTADLGNATKLTVVMVNSAVLDQPRAVQGSFEAEMAWLEGALGARAPGPTIVVSHHPPFLEDPAEGPNYWNIPPARRRPFLELLADSGVDLLLCGHRHRNDSVHYGDMEIVTTSAVGFPLGTDPPGFRVVEVGGSGISHSYYPLSDPGWEEIGGPPEPAST